MSTKDVVAGDDVRTLAQLEVAYMQAITPGSDGIRSITIYLKGDS